MHRGLPLLLLVLASGCATAKLAQEKAVVPADPGVEKNLVLEPFFEIADWKTTTRTDYATVSPGYGPYNSAYGSSYGYGGYGSGTVPVTTTVTVKPLFARADILVELHRKVLLAVQALRPSWRVTSTGGASLLEGEAVVVRTVIEAQETTVSDRTLKSFCFGAGIIIWPLLICAGYPVEETEHVTGLVERFVTSAEIVKARLVKYPTQPDFAVNLAGLQPLRRPFGLDVTYTEGVLANEGPRQGVLIEGLVDRLAAAVVAIVEEGGGPSAPIVPPPPPMPPPSPSPVLENDK